MQQIGPNGQPVKVQSGVALGMKIALGFVLFVVLVGVGGCLTCAGCMGAAMHEGAKNNRLRDAGAQTPDVEESKTNQLRRH